MKTHAMVTFGNEHYLLDDSEHQRIKKVGDKDFFIASDGSEVRGSSIRLILPIKAYYEKFPDRRSETGPQLSEEYQKLLGERGTYVPLENVAASSEKRLRRLIEGIRRSGAQVPLKRAIRRYETAYGPYKD